MRERCISQLATHISESKKDKRKHKTGTILRNEGIKTTREKIKGNGKHRAAKFSPGNDRTSGPCVSWGTRLTLYSPYPTSRDTAVIKTGIPLPGSKILTYKRLTSIKTFN